MSPGHVRGTAASGGSTRHHLFRPTGNGRKPRSDDAAERADRRVLIITEEFRPPFDEGGTVLALSFINGMTGDRIVFNRCAEAVHIPGVTVRTVPVGLSPVQRAISRCNFVIGSIVLALRYRPDQTYYLPLCAPGTARQLHALVLHAVSRQFQQVLFQTREPNRMLRSLSRFPMAIASASARNRYLEAGLNVEPFDIRGNAPGHTEYDRAALRVKYGIPVSRLVLLHVGHSTPGRGLKVLERLAEMCPDVHLVLRLSARSQSNEPQERPNLQVLREFVDDVFELYALADAYVFPLQSPAAAVDPPLSLLEARHMRLPIISTDLPHLRELLADYPDATFFPVGCDDTALQCLRTLAREVRR